MGAFAFDTQLPVSPDGGVDLSSASDCPFFEVEQAGNFSFEGTFSRRRGSAQAWFTLGGISRDAGFDGQVVTATLTAPRQFEACDGGVSMTETLAVALLSHSQDSALGGACPPNALDGGVPFNPDAGVLRPDTTPEGFDAVRACGILVDVVVPPSEICDGGFPSPERPCTLRYPVAGVRR